MSIFETNTMSDARLMSDAKLSAEIKKAYFHWKELVAEKDRRRRQSIIYYTEKGPISSD